MFCTHPENSMDYMSKERYQHIMAEPYYANLINKNNWTFIAGGLRPYELDEVNFYD